VLTKWAEVTPFPSQTTTSRIASRASLASVYVGDHSRFLASVSMTHAQAPIPCLGLKWLNAGRHPSKTAIHSTEKRIHFSM